MQACFKSLVILLFGGLVEVCFCQPTNHPPNRLTAEEKLAGWELLFDGQTVQGWRSPSSTQLPDGHWIVEDGFLKGARIQNRATDLMTTGTYRNFELTFEWKIASGGNSGVKYFVGRSARLVFEGDKPPVIEGTVGHGPDAFFKDETSGFEYQMIDDEQHPDKKDAKTRSGSLYQFVGPSQIATKPIGQLNRSRIIVNGTHIEHWLNGAQAATMDTNSTSFRDALAKVPERSRRVVDYLDKDRPIALQSHTGDVWFRNLKIRKLPVAP